MPDIQEKHDWQTIVEQVNSSMTLQAIGNACGLSLQAIHDLKSGRNAEPRHGAGQTLLRLYKRELNKQARQAAREKQG